jgi:hypothetical protein
LLATPGKNRPCIHEARSSTPNPGEHLFEARAHSRKEILVNDEKWLDGPHGVIILDDQIAVLEFILSVSSTSS